MSRTKIIKELEILHQLGTREMKYEKALLDFPEKSEEINKWLAELRIEIEDKRNFLLCDLRSTYHKDIVGRYLLRINATGSSGGKPTGWGLHLFHVTGVYMVRKENTIWHEDVCFNVCGESLVVCTDANKKITRFEFNREHDEFDGGPGYLDTNSFYEINPASRNGWKETTKDDYISIKNKITSMLISDSSVDLEEFTSSQFDIEYIEFEKENITSEV